MTYPKEQHAEYMRGWRIRSRERRRIEDMEVGYTTATDNLVSPEMVRHVAGVLLTDRMGPLAVVANDEVVNSTYRDASLALLAAHEILKEAQEAGR